MRTRILKFNVLLLTITIMLFASCAGLLESENLEEGMFTFWSNFDGPPIDIFVDNTYYGSINTFYPSNPGCDADGCVTVLLGPGTYNFEAVEQSGNMGTPKEWDGTIEIKADVCSTLGLSP
jgi:hypothetical protein